MDSHQGEGKIMDLPPELLELIFRNLTFKEVGRLRIVCHYFNTVSSSLLNSEFSRLRMNMLHRFQNIKAQMPRRESARRKHPLARESDIIETLHMRLTLLHMSFGKHIERKHCCFFAGEILDEVYGILRYVKNTPTLNRAYKVTDELFDLSTMAMEYFKEHIEPRLPEIAFFAADFLDYPPTSANVSLMEEALLCGASSVCKLPPKKVKPPAPAPYHPPQPFTVTINKKLRRMRETIKKNNTDLTFLKQELKLTKKKIMLQQKQITDLKARNEDYDRKFQTTSRKLSAVLQEVNRFKTEFQFWRSKSPASMCSCGSYVPAEGEGNNLSYEENLSYEDSMLDASSSRNTSSYDFQPILLETNDCQPSCSYTSKDVSFSHDSDEKNGFTDEDSDTSEPKSRKRKLESPKSPIESKKKMLQKFDEFMYSEL